MTYAQLKGLRDNAQLIPGHYYLINDYVTTSSESYTSVGGHLFDVIVLADSVSSLSEEAFAARSDRDTGDYFAESNLSAWKLRYCLDNDTSRFGWADTTNGKGVIYRMVDEFNNDVPYDFKNIIFHFVKFFIYMWGLDDTKTKVVRDSSLDSGGYYGWRTADGTVPDRWPGDYCFTDTEDITKSSSLYSDTAGTRLWSESGFILSVSTKELTSYTFQKVNSGVISDATLHKYGTYGLVSCNNTIKPYQDQLITLNSIIFGPAKLNWTVFSDKNSLYVWNNFIDVGNHENIFEGSFTHNNIIGVDFCNNIFGKGAKRNKIGPSFSGNTIGQYFDENTISYSFYDNVIGNNFSGNQIDTVFGNNNIGDYFSKNVIQYGFTRNNIGSSFGYNTIGNNFGSNTVGEDFQYNAVGSQVGYNTIGNYVKWSEIEDGCQYLIFDAADGSWTNFIQYVRICRSLKGASTTNPLTITPVRKTAYEQEFVNANKVVTQVTV